jgi:hypothetical protein
MYVEWVLREVPVSEGGGVQVRIWHELTYPIAPLTNWFARDIVGGIFVSYIAGRTLARIKQLAESEA